MSGWGVFAIQVMLFAILIVLLGILQELRALTP